MRSALPQNAHHRPSRPSRPWRRNAGDVHRWTFAELRRVFPDAKYGPASYVFDAKAERFGPYSGPRGVYLVVKVAYRYDDFDVVTFDPNKYELRFIDRRFTRKELAVWYAKHLAGVPLPSLASALKELGVEDPKAVASAWIDATKAAIVEDMRDGFVDLTVQAWRHPVSHRALPTVAEDASELAAYVDPVRRYAQKMPWSVVRAVDNITYGNPSGTTTLLALVAQEVDAWLSKGGAVKELKRLVAAKSKGGDEVFRYNPTPAARHHHPRRRARS